MQFIFGRAGTGKSTYCLEEIAKEIKRDPLGAPLVLLVPEQATHQMEMRLAKIPELGGILRAQVLSFRRLGWRIFSETGGGQKTILGEMGKRMLLRRLLLQYKPQLQIFARSATRPGMADLLAQMIREFKIYRVTPKDLRSILDLNSSLTQKLQELALLYDGFNQALGCNILDPDDELEIVALKIPSSPSLQNSTVWIDGFKGFTPQELYVVEYILRTVQDVIITLPLDPVFIHRQASYSFTPDEGIFKHGEEFFSGPWRTYQSLIRVARETSTPILDPIFLEKTHRFRNPKLSFLEKHYFTYPTLSYPENGEEIADEGFQGIRLFSAVNRREEVHGVARELRRLAREEGLRWLNMAVVTRDLSVYQETIQHVFNEYDLPFFLDSKRPILHHPLLELLMSALEVAQKDWAYEPLFRSLKTGFFSLAQDSLDRLENYCLAYGIRGEAWTAGKEWNYKSRWRAGDQKDQLLADKENEICINDARQIVLSSLQSFVEAVTSFEPLPSDDLKRISVRTVTEALYNLLIHLNVPESLDHWAEEARDSGNLAEARLQEQIWDAVIEVLDEMITGLGEESLELQDYALILSSGLENLKLGLIPPGLDQILVGSLDRSRNPEIRVLFLLGANEGILPARPASDGVLDSDEREQLEQLGMSLAPKGKAQLYEEQFFIYTGLTLARDRLYVSYPLTDEEGKGLTISPVVTRLRTLFSELHEQYIGNLDNDLEQLSHPQPLLPAYATQLLQLRQHKALSPMWQAVQEWYKNASGYQWQVKLLEAGVLAENYEEKLSNRLARRLYGKRLLASVSRLEEFARCPFAHYSKYGLKLKERPIYQLASPDMGRFFHAVLRDFAEKVQHEKLDWGAMSKEDSWNIVSELAEIIAPRLQNEILLSNARYRYLKHKLKRTVHHAVRVLGEHAQKGSFVPIQLEVPFGPDKVLPGIEVPLQDGNSLLLRGQIDRVDAAVLDGKVYLRILDYKSRQKHVSLDHIYYGLDLQLLAYLDAALQGAEVLLETLPSKQVESSEQIESSNPQSLEMLPVSPAGFLYFPVIEPQLDSKTLLSTEEVEAKRITAVKVKGFLLANRQVLEAMDQTLSTGQSDLLGIKLTKTMEFRKNANVLTNDQFSLLREHLHTYLQNSGEEILSGNIAISPYRQGKENACQYCEFKPVCHFDSFLPENQYRDLRALSDPEVWDIMDLNSKITITETTTHSPELNWLGDDFSEKVDEKHE
ncbi:helicase-exonuclease AddAB subunit AddB [Desulfitobacterium metallireducens]|uniref:helicase-exonuclease AddAB subunit AddB n=1 Tax=Desulfitobacterium metallireducens TaxID=142877 RepID=UPI00059D3C99|nr:helicase-exonuclease AddAB subunit AddB [Desulfitobacterium metallireducens]